MEKIFRTVINVDGQGFFCDEIEHRLLAHEESNRDLIISVCETVRFASETARNLRAYWPQETPQEHQKVVALALLFRMLEIVESMLILASYGVREEINSLFRIFLDAYFLICNVCDDLEFVSEYMRTDEVNRQKIINSAAQHTHDIFAVLKKNFDAEERAELNVKIREENIQGFNSRRYAQKIGCAAIYDSMYRVASSSVHTSPRCFLQYIEHDEQGNVTKFINKGNLGAAYQNLHDTGLFFLKALRATAKLFECPIDDEVLRLERMIEQSMDKEPI